MLCLDARTIPGVSARPSDSDASLSRTSPRAMLHTVTAPGEGESILAQTLDITDSTVYICSDEGDVISRYSFRHQVQT